MRDRDVTYLKKIVSIVSIVFSVIEMQKRERCTRKMGQSWLGLGRIFLCNFFFSICH